MDDETTITMLEQRVAQLEALVERLTESTPEQGPDGTATAVGTPAPAAPATTAYPPTRPTTLDRIASLESRLDDIGPGEPVTAPLPHPPDAPSARDEPSGPTAVGRRHLLGRAGTAAVGAVLGGTVAAITTASPAAAATGSFDTSTATPALTATTSSAVSNGVAIEATSTGAARALAVGGRSAMTAVGNVLEIDATGPNAVGVWSRSDIAGGIFSGERFGVWALGEVAVRATGSYIGLLAAGETAQLLLWGLPDNPMPSPPTRADAHQRGEVYFDDDSVLWLCIADGTPGTWSRVGGAGTAGPLTMLDTPTRVYDTRTGSGLPGAGTGPVTGVRHGIDLTANGSGVPVDATAAMVTLTVTTTIANLNAYGQIYADALTTPPGTSTINWTDANTIVATTTTTALTDGRVAISMQPGANVLIDVLGYHR